MLGYRARNGDDHPRRGPGRDRTLSDELHNVFREGVVEGQPAGDPALGAPHEGGDPALRELVVVMELPHECCLLDEVPLSAMDPGEYPGESLFLRAVPDLRSYCIASAVLHGLHPQVAVKEYEGVGDDHGDELADTFDGGGQGEALFRPLDSRVGIAEVELRDLNLPNLSEMPVHAKELTGRDGSRPSRLLSPLSVSMGRKRPCANAFENDLVFYHSDFVVRDKDNQLLERLCGGYLVFYHLLLSSPWLHVGLVEIGEVVRVLLIHPSERLSSAPFCTRAGCMTSAAPLPGDREQSTSRRKGTAWPSPTPFALAFRR